MPEVTVQQAIELAMQHRQVGRLAEAEAIFRQILAVQPGHADALHGLGVIAHQAGRDEIAAGLIRQAIAANPSAASYYFSLGVMLARLGRLDEAIAAYRGAIQLKPDYVEAHNNLGNTLKDRGRPGEAVAVLRRAIEMKPDYTKAHSNLGVALKDEGRIEESIAAYRRAIELDPDYAEAQNNLGNALRDQGLPDEAIAAYCKAIKSKPDSAEVHNNLGNVLTDQGRLDEAVAACRRAIEIKPDFAEAHSNLGNVLKKQGRLNDAIAAYRKAIEIRPDFTMAHTNMGVALMAGGRVDAAIGAYRRALELEPDSAKAHSNLLYALHCVPELDGGGMFREHCRWGEMHARPLEQFIRSHGNDRDAGRRLRIGYVSPDFRQHPVAFFMENVLACHDRAEVEVYCYADLVRADWMTERLRQHAGQWRGITGMKDEQVAELIRREQIDILVDLAGHTAGNRLLVFARKPAPVQVSWLGYFDTTGVKAMDYRLTDGQADPLGAADEVHVERLVRLPEVFACFRPAEESPVVGPLPAAGRGHVTFASFHGLAKVNERLLEWWAQILGRVAGSRLLMVANGLDEEEGCRRRIIDFFGSRGIGAGRLEFKGHQSLQGYLGLHNEVDVMLDSHPFSGHTVSCHALWMGVPVVTLSGERHCSRMVTSVLGSVGLGELVARTPAEYVEMASVLAGNCERLAEMRMGLRERMAGSALTDGRRFARNLERAYREMWVEWCANPCPPQTS